MSRDTQAREDVVEEFAAAYDGLCEAVAVSAGAIPAPTEGEHNGMPWKVSPPSGSQAPYPQSETHQFGCWPVLVIETGGYNDVEIIDPFTRRRLWIGNMWTDRDNGGVGPVKTDGPAEGRTTADALRRTADVLDATGFLEQETEVPASRT